MASVCAKLFQLGLTLWDPMDCSLLSQGGILQERILKWVVMTSSRGSSQEGDWTCVSYVSCIGRWVLYISTTWEAHYYKKVKVLATQSYWLFATPWSVAHRLLYSWDSKGKILGWVVIPFSRGSFLPRIERGSPALQTDSLPPEPPGNPLL